MLASKLSAKLLQLGDWTFVHVLHLGFLVFVVGSSAHDKTRSSVRRLVHAVLLISRAHLLWVLELRIPLYPLHPYIPLPPLDLRDQGIRACTDGLPAAAGRGFARLAVEVGKHVYLGV